MDKRKIVRSRSAGVFFGIVSLDGTTATITNARRLWYWDGAASLSQLAVDGVVKPGTCKFPCVVSEIKVFDVIEILSVTEKAAATIDSVAVWEILERDGDSRSA